MKNIDSFFEKGKCKICVPLMGRTDKEIIDNLEIISAHRFDVLEWRADFYEGLYYDERLCNMVLKIKEKLGNKPLLFTVRTSKEGGNAVIASETYKNILLYVIEGTQADMVDVEYMRDNDVNMTLVEAAHKKGKYIIGSYHDFNKTPDKDEIYDRLLAMKRLGMDISKIALMPQNKKDVLSVFEATEKINADIPDIYTVTMSMGELGAISRIALGKFGSVMTFGAVGEVSAPGQYGADELSDIIDIIY